MFFKDNFLYQNFKDFNFDKALGNDNGPYAWGANTVYREADSALVRALLQCHLGSNPRSNAILGLSL